MRTIESQQAAEVCHAIADEIRAEAAQPETDLTPTDRRHLRAIAAAVLAQIEPEPPTEAAEPHAG